MSLRSGRQASFIHSSNSVGVRSHIANKNVDAGARGLRQLIPNGERLAIVLQAYTSSIDNVMYIGIGVSCVAFAFAWGLGFKDIRKEKAMNHEQTQKSTAAKESDPEGGL